MGKQCANAREHLRSGKRVLGRPAPLPHRVWRCRRTWNMSAVRKLLSLSVQRGLVTCVRKLPVPLPYAFANPPFRSTMGCSISSQANAAGPQKPSGGESEDEYVETVAGESSIVGDGAMKAVSDEAMGSILLVRQNGKLSAVGGKCTHYGAPLEKGALGNGRVRCPWHGACFNITTGDIEDFPGLDSLPCYQVEEKDGLIKVRAKRSQLNNTKRVKSMCSYDPRESSGFLIVGGGPSAATCVETLRQEGFSGRITMVAKENCLPYDRIKLSKTMDVEIEKIQLRNDAFYKEHNIDVLKDVEAVALDAAANKVTLSDGKVVEYSKVFLATGATPLKARIPGCDLKNVMVLRTFADAHSIHTLLGEDKEVVILGASFIAMEAASYCVSKARKVTVIGRDSVPFRALLGAEIGEAVKSLYVEKGVNFAMNSGMKACVGNDQGEVVQVELVNGDLLQADVVIMGVGSKFNTDFLKNSGVTLEQNGSVPVTEHMKTNIENVFAGGDIAYAPVYTNDGHKSAIGHFSLAHYHGRIAALNMLDKPTELKAVPFFWTMFFGKGIRYAGHGQYDEILHSGTVSSLKFVAYYMKGDRVVAVASCQMDPIVAKYAELRAQGKELYRQDLGEDLIAWSN